MPFGHLWEEVGSGSRPGGVPEPSRHVFFRSSSRDHSATPHPHWFFRFKASAFFYAFTLEALVLVKRLILSALVILTGFYITACGGKSHAGGGGSQNPLLTINAVTMATGYVGSNFTSITLHASGGSGTGYTWSVSGGTSLPAGITLSAGGVLGGKPTAEG